MRQSRINSPQIIAQLGLAGREQVLVRTPDAQGRGLARGGHDGVIEAELGLKNLQLARSGLQRSSPGLKIAAPAVSEPGARLNLAAGVGRRRALSSTRGLIRPLPPRRM
jgi:hypothetical protein